MVIILGGVIEKKVGVGIKASKENIIDNFRLN